jgi:SAM-dependent methyltransferase
MAKEHEIDYIRRVAKTENVPIEQFRQYLMRKPFSDIRCGEYLMDIAQVLSLLPPPPAKLLDVGVGSGWTSELFAMRGYDVLGLDISPDMIDLANLRSGTAKFMVCDYEAGPIPGGFDIAVIYDALHHAEDELSVLLNVYKALSDRGVVVTIEPGVGHSSTTDSVEVMRKYGTTEKDMPFSHQNRMMKEVGFRVVEQYVRLSQLQLENMATFSGALRQVRHGVALGYGSATGSTSVVMARKCATGSGGPSTLNNADGADVVSASRG